VVPSPEPTPIEADDRPSTSLLLFAPLGWLRGLALLAVAATVLGRAVGPALRGLDTGLDAWVGRMDVLGAGLSQFLLPGQVAMLVAVTLSVLRMGSLPIGYRMVATGLAGVVLGLSAPASSTRLTPIFSASLALAAIVAALFGTAQSIVAKHTRILGVLLGLMTLGALTRQTAWVMALVGGQQAALRMALASRWVATVALLVHAVAVAVALIWLATRQRRIASLWTTVASVLAVMVSWLTDRATQGSLGAGKALAVRSAAQLLSQPPPLVAPGVRVFVTTLGLLLALVAATRRREAPAVVSAMALVLVAGLDLDVPLCALSLTVASLAASLAAQDPSTATFAGRVAWLDATGSRKK
jgi:hypothetical protein